MFNGNKSIESTAARASAWIQMWLCMEGAQAPEYDKPPLQSCDSVRGVQCSAVQASSSPLCSLAPQFAGTHCGLARHHCYMHDKLIYHSQNDYVWID